MATKVFDLAIEEMPIEFDRLEEYTKALLLYRYHGIPVGKVEMLVVNGRINQIQLYDAIINPWSCPLWQQILHDYLD